MSKSTAWGKEGFSPADWHVAEGAANRARATLEQGLDPAIVRQASVAERAKFGRTATREVGDGSGRDRELTGAVASARDEPSIAEPATARDLPERLGATT